MASLFGGKAADATGAAALTGSAGALTASGGVLASAGASLIAAAAVLAGSAASGAIASAFGGGSAPLGNVLSMLGDVPFFAGGTDFAPGGAALVGEHGPELVKLPMGAQVIPNDVLQAKRNAKGGGDTTLHVTVNVPQTTSRATADQIARETGTAIQRAMARIG